MHKGTRTTIEPEAARAWWVVDGNDRIVGRLASRVAGLLLGKDKPGTAPHQDAGDFVVVTNAAGVVFSGAKERDKRYHTHSQRPGGLRSVSPARLRKHRPEEILRRAVSGMLPKNRLRQARLRRLKIYAGGEHPHGAQAPSEVEW